MKRRIFLFTVSFIFLISSFSFAQEAKVFFSPQGGCTGAIVSALSKARQTLDIAMYSFTSDDIAQEIVQAKRKGTKIRMICDKTQAGQRASQIEFLKTQGIPVRIYQGAGIMHNKFAVIDGKVLMTGSFNWTTNAEDENAENLLILTDQKLIAKYEKEFGHLWVQGEEEPGHQSFSKIKQNLMKYLMQLLKEFSKILFKK